jgi:hypothetical protein
LFAPPFSRQLNSDAAIHLLMTLRWEGVASLYFWGQDRLGSLVPLAAMPLAKAGVPPVWAYSVVLWGILFLMWEGLAGLLLSPVARVLLAWIVWFPFPTVFEFLLPGHPYAPQMALLAWAWRWICQALTTGNVPMRVRASLLSGLFTGVAVWVSEFTAVFVAVLVFLMLMGLILLSHRSWKYLFLPWVGGFITLLLLVIWIKKHHPHPVSIYGRFLGTPDGFVKGIHTSLHFFSNAYDRFRDDPFTFFSLICLGVAAIITALAILKQRRPGRFPLSGLFFFINGVAAIPALWASAWVQLSGCESRYFTYPVSFLMLALIFCGDVLLPSKGKKLYYGFTALGFALYGIRTVEREFVLSRLDVRNFSIRELQEEPVPPGGGIVGQYWNSYILALGRNPTLPVSAEESAQRNEALARETMSQDSVWVCGTGWFKDYPRYLIQFNRILERSGPLIKGKRLEFCLYRPVSLGKIRRVFLTGSRCVVPFSYHCISAWKNLEFYRGTFSGSNSSLSEPLYFFFYKNPTRKPLINITWESLKKDNLMVTLPFFRFPNCETDTCLMLLKAPHTEDPWRLSMQNFSPYSFCLLLEMWLLPDGLVRSFQE